MNRGMILIIDDDEGVRTLVHDVLERAGYRVFGAEDGSAGIRELYARRPDLVLLDVTMPGLSGWEVLERIRELTDVGVIMLTARDAELEKVRGLKAGADDYVGKPFGLQELQARVESVLRRRGAATELQERYDDGVIAVDFGDRTVTVNGRPLQLTPLEFRLLAAFVRHPGQLLSHAQLLELAWGDPGQVSRDQVKLYVGYLREKLRGQGLEGSPIETVRGFGYRYRAPKG